jgi:undecaprenyl-diphosphatase
VIRHVFAFASALAMATAVWGQPAPEAVTPESALPAGSASANGPVTESPVVPLLTVREAAILGVVEGITEFVPISSTGHLIIASRLLGLEDDKPLRDGSGELIWLEPPGDEHPAGVPLTLTIATDTYIVVIQLGAILAVVLVFWGQLMGIVRGLMGRDAAGLRLLRNLLLAFFPVVVAGLALGDLIEEHLFSIGTVVAALVSGAILMWGAERWRRGHEGTTASRKEPADLTPREALQVGLVQCLALWPGMSRSMVTMVGGYFVGLSPARAAEFSFLVGLPVLGGAAFYKAMRTGPAMLAVFGWTEMIVGAAVATISAFFAVRFLIAYLSRYGLGVFAIYRIVLALVLLLLMWRNVL